MQALILSDDYTLQSRLTLSLKKRGIQVINAESIEMAIKFARNWTFDLLVMPERIDDQLTHRLALSAERNSPDIATVLISGRTDSDVDELYELIPSLSTILGIGLAPELISQMALVAISGQACQINAIPTEPDAVPAMDHHETTPAKNKGPDQLIDADRFVLSGGHPPRDAFVLKASQMVNDAQKPTFVRAHLQRTELRA